MARKKKTKMTSKQLQVLTYFALLYDMLLNQNRSPFPAKVMKAANNERF